MPPLLIALIPELVSLLLPAAEHALGADASDKQVIDWVKPAVKNLLEKLVFVHVKVPNWAQSLEPEIEQLIADALEKELGALEK